MSCPKTSTTKPNRNQPKCGIISTAITNVIFSRIATIWKGRLNRLRISGKNMSKINRYTLTCNWGAELATHCFHYFASTASSTTRAVISRHRPSSSSNNKWRNIRHLKIDCKLKCVISLRTKFHLRRSQTCSR